MTEAEWLSCGEVMALLRATPYPLNPRKLRLFAVACWRQMPIKAEGDLATEFEGRLGVAERYADDQADDWELNTAYSDNPLDWGREACVRVAVEAARLSAVHSAALPRALMEIVESSNPPLPVSRTPPQSGFFGWLKRAFLGDAPAPVPHPSSIANQEMAQCELWRDIFGNPFRPATFDPSWRTDSVCALAAQMYDSRDFAAMPILADALQDAGCDSPDILAHCREEGATHVRGCWVVDLVLGRE